MHSNQVSAVPFDVIDLFHLVSVSVAGYVALRRLIKAEIVACM